MDASSHNVLLVGGGGAGLRAAIAVAEVNPKRSSLRSIFSRKTPTLPSF
jgi:succinate dehydrogenase/fumarate reductase flavoprotein subunit